MNDHTEKLDDLMDRYLFGLLDGNTKQRVRQKIEIDPEWQLAYESAFQRKAVLNRLAQSDRDRAEAGPLPNIKAIVDAADGIGRRMRRINYVFGGLAAALVLVVAGAWLHVALTRPANYVFRYVGRTELMSGGPASLRVVVEHTDGRPAPGVPVRLALAGPDGETFRLARWTSDAGGVASGVVELPDVPEGRYRLEAQTGRNPIERLDVNLQLQRAAAIYLSTDKPVYQPGQTLHFRTLALRKPAMTPMAGETVRLSVIDPSGNRLYDDEQPLSPFGIASGDMPLDPLITPGRYTVEAEVGGETSRQTVDIYHYTLPPFSVKLRPGAAWYRPGERVEIEVAARYHFGQPVDGAQVEVQLVDPSFNDVVVTARGITGSEGRATVTLALPDTLVALQRHAGLARLTAIAEVIDRAEQRHSGSQPVVVSENDIMLSAVVDPGMPRAGVDARLFIVARYPDGRPAECVVRAETMGLRVRTDAAGAAVIEASLLPSTVALTAIDDEGRTGRTEVGTLPAGGEGLLLRVDPAVCDSGDTLTVTVVSPEPDGRVYLDVVKDGQTLLTQIVELTGHVGQVALDVPPSVFGTLRLNAYRLNADSEWVGREALALVRPSRALNVSVEADRSVYRPGDDAQLVFRVTGEDGRPVVSAIGLAAVDAAVFSLHGLEPGLESTMAGLDRALLTPHIQTFPFDAWAIDKSPAYAKAMLTAAADGLRQAEPARRESVLQRLATDEETAWLIDRVREIPPQDIQRIIDSDVRLTEVMSPALLRELTGANLPESSNRRTISRDYEWRRDQLETRAQGLGVAAFAIGIVGLLVYWTACRLAAPRETLPGIRVKRLTIRILAFMAIVMVVGSMLMPVLRQARRSAQETSLSSNLRGLGMAELMQAEASRRRPAGDILTPLVEPGPTQQTQPSVRIRSDFPETLLWRPQIITGADGTARLSVPLADSITTWRLAGSAVDATGRLGALDGEVRVFQPFFVAIDVPVALTRGDEVSLPVIVYNYTGEPLAVTLRAEGSAGLSVLDAPAEPVQAGPGGATRTYVRVRAERAGEAELTVHAHSGGEADAIRRRLRIDPPGLPQTLVVSGVVEGSSQTVEFRVPSDAVDGSVHARLRLYPNTFSQVLEGLESMLGMPHGCFEQSSSITYPNVMIQNYLNKTGMQAPESAATAHRYIQLGYQRMVGFEVAGGGFSLYGHAPADLGLTAFGLMLLADMAEVYPVDRAMIERTTQWLVNQRGGRSHWGVSGRTRLMMSNPSTDSLTAYITLALARADRGGRATTEGANYLRQQIDGVRDAHTLALFVLALEAMGDSMVDLRPHRQRLAELAQRGEGAGGATWAAGSQSMAYGGGRWGAVEATALAVQALVGDARFAVETNEGLVWLVAVRDGRGGWGTTQPTVQALKALIAGTATPRRRDAVASLDAEIVGEGRPSQHAGRLSVAPSASETVGVTRLEGIDKPGPVALRLNTEGAEGLPFQVVVHYTSEVAARHRPEIPGGPTIDVLYDRTTLTVGGRVVVTATIENPSREPARLPLADIGTPPGFRVLTDGLKGHEAIDRHTVGSRGLILYLRTLAPGERVVVRYDLEALTLLNAVAPPSRVYTYYEPEKMGVSQAVRMRVN